MTASMKCPDCDNDYWPLDIVEGYVEIDAPITRIDDNGRPQGYEPTGTTDVLWDTQQSIGYGCSRCGDVTITVERIKIGNEEFFLHPASNDRFGR